MPDRSSDEPGPYESLGRNMAEAMRSSNPYEDMAPRVAVLHRRSIWHRVYYINMACMFLAACI